MLPFARRLLPTIKSNAPNSALRSAGYMRMSSSVSVQEPQSVLDYYNLVDPKQSLLEKTVVVSRALL